MNRQEQRIDAIAGAIAACGHEAVIAPDFEGVVAFDRAEPEYATFKRFTDAEIGTYRLRAVLGISAGIVDYRLNGNAHQFWSTLEDVVMEDATLTDADDVKRLLGAFMDQSVNSRLNTQKRTRLAKLFENGFVDWFLDNGPDTKPELVWERLAAALETDQNKATIVFAMKVYDEITLIETGSYLQLPRDIPIPCNYHIKRVAKMAGLVETDDESAVMAAWKDVMEEVNDRLQIHISPLRIDSIVWQAGQAIGDDDSDRPAARDALIDHFTDIGLRETDATRLADEFTAAI